jgi:glycosyltransferase involved in cell wall biosynthesis
MATTTTTAGANTTANAVGSRQPLHVVMLGTDLTTHGGISSVVATYRAHGLFDRWPIHYVATHRDGSRLAKLGTALRALAAMLALVVRQRRAVLHVHAASRASFWRKCVFMAIGLAAGWQLVFHLHGGGFARFYGERGPVGRAIVRFFLNRAAYVIVVSERWRAWVLGIAQRPRIVCVPNPVSLPAAVSRSREPGLVVFSGRCEASKGIFDLLEAAGMLRAQVPGLRIECAGDGDLGKVRRYAESMNLGARVKLRGWLGKPAAAQLLGRASVFVLPSYAEGLPMSLLEAMAAGCPVVATAVGGIPDLVTDGVDGLLVPPGDPEALADALQQLLQDRAFAARLGNAARETVANRYAAERSLERLEQVYSGLGVCRESPRKLQSEQTLQEIS